MLFIMFCKMVANWIQRKLLKAECIPVFIISGLNKNGQVEVFSSVMYRTQIAFRFLPSHYYILPITAPTSYLPLLVGEWIKNT